VLALDWAVWDTPIKGDARSGKLDELFEEAREDFKESRAREL